MAETTPLPRCGLIVHRRGDDAEELLARFAERLKASPLRVGGMVQRTTSGANGATVMTVEDIATGHRLRISQDLGGGSTACCLDHAALADAAMWLRGALDRGVDLLIANKFAGLEIEGQGVAAEIFAALSDGVPVLTLVAERHLAGWRALAGPVGEELPPTMDALDAWLADAVHPLDHKDTTE